MALLKYLKRCHKTTTSLECLLDACGPLAITMSSSCITAANSSVAKVLEKQQKQAETKELHAHGEYRIYMSKERGEIGKRVARNF